jgi:hypothetical protein
MSCLRLQRAGPGGHATGHEQHGTGTGRGRGWLIIRPFQRRLSHRAGGSASFPMPLPVSHTPVTGIVCAAPFLSVANPPVGRGWRWYGARPGVGVAHERGPPRAGPLYFLFATLA